MTLTELKETCIFRYRNFNKNTKREVVNFEIWHSNIEGLNDPFEFPIIVSWDKLHSKDKSLLINYALKYKILNEDELSIMLMDEKNYGVQGIHRVIMENLERSTIALNDYVNTLLVCCFSENMESPLMWSHYADGMRGVCIAYSRKSFENHENFNLKPVVYNTHPIEFNHDDLKTIPVINEFKSFDFKNSEHILSEGRLVRLKSQKYLFQKHISWEYEGEIRNIVDPNKRLNGQLVSFPKSAIKAIIVGGKMPYHNARMVLKFCRKNNLSMFVAYPDKAKYKVKFESVI
ncbi:DUF2971 domain-containing protein [Klebsiella quasivariicola]|uniref:DUF2971 domain-containing protein n=1 Tax=Klebsiella quasivariicola TaxID=2026240 RepID=UPI001CD013EB|nr:DUF2971 domain-containing protein [Klebsiella quasivariicola]MBZ9582962.1 DUF2971 domain-containing protein [Klebsiella quasivariicola]